MIFEDVFGLIMFEIFFVEDVVKVIVICVVVDEGVLFIIVMECKCKSV